jgi:hypothetical protein
MKGMSAPRIPSCRGDPLAQSQDARGGALTLPVEVREHRQFPSHLLKQCSQGRLTFTVKCGRISGRSGKSARKTACAWWFDLCVPGPTGVWNHPQSLVLQATQGGLPVAVGDVPRRGQVARPFVVREVHDRGSEASLR